MLHPISARCIIFFIISSLSSPTIASSLFFTNESNQEVQVVQSGSIQNPDLIAILVKCPQGGCDLQNSGSVLLKNFTNALLEGKIYRYKHINCTGKEKCEPVNDKERIPPQNEHLEKIYEEFLDSNNDPVKTKKYFVVSLDMQERPSQFCLPKNQHYCEIITSIHTEYHTNDEQQSMVLHWNAEDNLSEKTITRLLRTVLTESGDDAENNHYPSSSVQQVIQGCKTPGKSNSGKEIGVTCYKHLVTLERLTPNESNEAVLKRVQNESELTDRIGQ